MDKIILILIACIITTGCSESIDTNYDNQSTKITIQGRVVDGPIEDSLCFADLNGNIIWDEVEPKVQSNENGYYEFDLQAQNFDSNDPINTVCIGGIYKDTGKRLDSLILISEIPKTIDDNFLQTTPLTTLLSLAKTNNEKKEILNNLNITEELDTISKTDYYSIVFDTDKKSTETKQEIAETITKINYQIINIVLSLETELIPSLSSSSETGTTNLKIFESIAEEISKTPEDNPLINTGFISNIINDSINKLNAEHTIQIAIDFNKSLVKIENKAIDIDQKSIEEVKEIMIDIHTNAAEVAAAEVAAEDAAASFVF